MKKKQQINPRQEQQQKLQELGTRLQQLRTQKGISLELIANKTMIQARLLRAIEEANLAILPEPVYIRSLIQRFANELGLDGMAFASEFPTTTPPTRLKGNFAWFSIPSFQFRPFHLYLFYVLVIMFSVRSLSNQVQTTAGKTANQDSNLTSEVKPKPPIVKPAVSTTRAVRPTIALSQTTQPNNLGEEVVVEISAKEECWLKVVVDGKTEFEGILPQGSHRQWTATDAVTVRAGNAGGVLLGLNNEQAKELGQPGQVQEVTYQVNRS